jgi:glycerol dehydrogenase
MMEGRSHEFLNEIYGFCKAVGLPTTFQELGMRTVTDEALTMVAEDASRSVLIISMPRASSIPDKDGRFYDPHEIFNCLKAADAYGKKFRSLN